MKTRWLLVAALASSAALPAFSDEPREGVALPLGRYVRPGRPLGIRVFGGADRVRAPGTPWALPQGSDEFVLQLTGATTTLLSLEIERGGVVERVTMSVESLPAEGLIRGSFSGGESPGAVRVVQLPPMGLPTVPEAWLLLDELDDSAGPELREFLNRVAAVRPAERPFIAPHLAAPDPQAFAATAELAASAPQLPNDVATLLLLLAAAEVGLVLVLRSRELSAARRTAWLALPPLAALAFIATGSRLPGGLSATAVAVDVGSSRYVLVRVDARRDGAASFAIPGGATAAMVRFAADDETVSSASAGRDVELRLAAGESRLFAYALPHVSGDGDSREPPPALAAWLRGRGLQASPAGSAFGASDVPRSSATVVIPAWIAASGASAPTK